MTIALRPSEIRLPIAARPGAAIARVEVFDDMLRAEPVWRALESGLALATPYQRFDFLAPWQREVGARAGIVPALIVGFDDGGQPVLLCPLGRRRYGPFHVAEFLGGKHANFNMPLWRRDVAGGLVPDDVRAIFAPLTGVDLVALRNQPENWDGIANPFRLLPQQPAPSFGRCGTLMADFAELSRARLNSGARKKLRKKERALGQHGALKFTRVATAGDAGRVLDAFFAQKAERMRRLGIANAFAGRGVREFIAAAATEQLASGRPAIELYACEVGDGIVATFAGLAGRDRFCGLFNSMTLNELAHESPGEILLNHVVALCCGRGFAVFDLGVGEARYKRAFCNQAEPLFDSFLPLSPRGRIAAWAAKMHGRAKRVIKQNAALWDAVDWLRRGRGRLTHRDA